MSSYYEQLKHPLWQNKKGGILARAGHKCENCDGTDTTLHAHHTYYERGRKPWEYPDDSLICLCEDCHETAEDLLLQIRIWTGRSPGDEYISSLRWVLGAAKARAIPSSQLHPIRIGCLEESFGFCSSLHISPLNPNYFGFPLHLKCEEFDGKYLTWAEPVDGGTP